MNETITFDKERGVKGSLSTAWKILALGWKHYLCSLWPFLLWMGLSTAFLCEMLLMYVRETAYPAYLAAYMGMDSEVVKAIASPNVSTIIYIICAVCLVLFSFAVLTSRICRLVADFRHTATFPRRLPLALSKDEWRCTARVVIIEVVSLLTLLVVCAAIFYLSVKVSGWMAIALPMLSIYILSTAHIAGVKYTVYGRTLGQSIGYGLKHALGLAFVVQILTAIPLFFVFAILDLPTLIYVCDTVANTRTLLMGDAVGMPTYVSFLFFVASAVAFAAKGLFGSYAFWTLALKLNEQKSETLETEKGKAK